MRFSEGDEIIAKITNTLVEILEFGDYNHKIIAFAVVDFIKVCWVHDKKSVEVFLTNNSDYTFMEKMFELDIKFDQVDFGNPSINLLLDIINKNQVVKLSLIVTRRMNILLKSINFDLLYRAARSIRDYKRAITYLEEHLRFEKLNKSYSCLLHNTQLQNNVAVIENELSYEELQELVGWYSKVLPEDYNFKDFMLASNSFNEFSQGSVNHSPAKWIEDKDIDILSQEFDKNFVLFDKKDDNDELVALLGKKSYTKILKWVDMMCK